MRITNITTHVLGTPWRDLTYVQVHTDEGLVGVGETRMLSHTQALLGYLAEAAPTHVLVRDPFDIDRTGAAHTSVGSRRVHRTSARGRRRCRSALRGLAFLFV